MITTFQFARMLAASLRGAAIKTVWPRWCPAGYRITGRMDAGPVVVPIEIHVWEDFDRLKMLPPLVWCKSPWMRDEADWHNSSATGMCWVLGEEWRDAMCSEDKRARAILEEGRSWLMNAVPCLISRHYTGFLEGLTKWPTEWQAWGHSDKGRKEYGRERRLARDGATTGRKE
jgi:hypothetical protein